MTNVAGILGTAFRGLMVIAVSTIGWVAAPAADAVVDDGPNCPDVMVVAVRGSSEQPQQEWTVPAAYAADARLGVGKPLLDVYQRLRTGSPSVQFGLDAIEYPADAVFPDVVTGIANFAASADSGAQAIADDVARTVRLCPTARFVIAGYSQGAWSVHKALWKMNATTLSQISAVVLLGDPEFVHDQSIIRDDPAALPLSGAAAGIDGRNTGVPTRLAALTASYCLVGDPVCQTSTANLSTCLASGTGDGGQCPHVRYVEGGRTTKAAEFVRALLPASRWNGGPWTAVSTSGGHTCGLRADRSLWCWGRNYAAELGVGDHKTRLRPTRVGRDNRWSSIATDYSRTCAVRTDGSLWCWGMVFGDFVGPLNPARFGTDSNWRSISLGTATCGVRTDGTLWCWGGNLDGQLGLGDVENRPAPTQVGTGNDWSSVSASGTHTCATTTGNALWCWGDNLAGEIGRGTKGGVQLTPYRVGGTSMWASVSAGQADTCAIRLGGSLWCWGSAGYGGLGIPGQTTVSRPTRVGTSSAWRSVSVVGSSACATRTDGSLWCWGYNGVGTLGLDDLIDRASPVRVGKAGNWAAAVMAGTSMCATRIDGGLWCTGANDEGELGLGDTTNRRTPTPVE